VANQISYALQIDGAPITPELLASTQQIEVEDHAEMADMLRLRLAVGVREDGSAWNVLDDNLFARLSNIKVDVSVAGGRPETVINGYVIETHVTFSNQPGQSVLNVVAMDPTVLMNLDEQVRPWPNMSDSDIATAIFSDRAYDFAPVVDSTSWRRQEADQTTLQRGTDIQFLQQIAKRNGFECYVETNSLTGRSEGHFHAPVLDKTPQGVLSVNMGETTNVNAFSARYEMLRPVTAQVTGLDAETRDTQPAHVTSSSRRALGTSVAVGGDKPRKVLLHRTGMAQAGELQAYAQAVVDQSAMAIKAEGELNTIAYGSLLHAKRLVAVRGAGRQFSGIYYVERVLHTFGGEGYKQRFSLRRNALGLTNDERFVEDRSLPA
jgi:phage protein D